MRKRMLGAFFLAFVAIAPISAAVRNASAGVIYATTFGTTGASTADLNGSNAGPANAAWTAPANTFTTGNGAATVSAAATSTTAGGGYTAYLPLTLEPNTLYTLTATLAPTAGGADWLAMGFGSATTGPAYGAGQAWLIYRDTGEADTLQNGTAASQQGKTASPANPDKFTIVFNSNTGAVSYCDTLNLVTGLSGTVTTPTDVSAVFIGNYQTAAGTFQKFSLSAGPVPVPEPASLYWAGAGLASLGAWLRLKRRRFTINVN